MELEQALRRRWPSATGCRNTALLRHRAVAAEQTGGALSETLENLADVIRKRVAVRQRGEALSAEAKTSAIVLGLLPPLAAVGLYVLNPLYVIVLFTDPGGPGHPRAARRRTRLRIMSMRFMIRKSLT